MKNEITRYMAGNCEIELTDDTIRNYLVNGNGKITDQELMMFKKLCEYQKLNPFLREVYIIKYSDQYPATVVTGKETFLKRANRNPLYKGHETGISDDGKTAWAKVHKDGYEVPITCFVDFDEYVGLKDGKPNKMWAAKPNTMLKKVALVQALREAFPEDLGGLYSQEEINTISHELPTEEIKPTNYKMTDDKGQGETSIEDAESRTKQDNNSKTTTQPKDIDGRNKITTRQTKLIYVLLQKMNITDDFKKHEKISNILGSAEVVSSMTDLTKQEACKVIDALQDMANMGE